MSAVGRGWVLGAVLFGAVGVLFLLMGLGVGIGRWWPAIFCAFGLASLIRGLKYSENVFTGFLLLGWGAAGVITLHHESLGIPSPWLFLIGILVLWIPVSALLAKVGSGDRH
jgi:hypothetical protein